jgi:hypothetical protein
MRNTLLAVVGCTLALAACVESRDSNSLLAPEFAWTVDGCKDGDVLVPWAQAQDPDKNADGFVCHPPLSKDPREYYDNKLDNLVGCKGDDVLEQAFTPEAMKADHNEDTLVCRDPLIKEPNYYDNKPIGKEIEK